MPAQQQHTSFTGYLSGSNGPMTAGYCVVLDSGGDNYVPSTSSARTTAGRRSTGIAITSCAGTSQDRAFEIQVVGDIDSSITGLGDGDASIIRVSSTGLLERVATYDSADDVVGYCDEDGTAHVCFPLAGLGVTFGAAGGPAGNAQAIQYKVDSSTFGGAARAFIDASGNIVLGVTDPANAATLGDLNTDGSFSVVGKYSLISDLSKYILRAASNGVVYVGALSQNYADRDYAQLNAFMISRYRTSIRTIVDSNSKQGNLGACGVIDSQVGWTGGYCDYNFLIGADPSAYTTTDIFNTGFGVLGLVAATVAPSGAPTVNNLAHIYLVTDNTTASNDHLWVKTKAGTSKDLLADSATTVNVTSAGGDVTITAATRVVNLNGSSLIVKGFTAPTTPAAGHIIVTNSNATTATIWINAGDTAANGIQQTSGFDRLEIAQYEAVALAYDYNAARWVVALGALQTTS